MNPSFESTNCTAHPNFKNDFLCLDPRCKNQTACCAHCLAMHHMGCNKNFSVSSDNFRQMVGTKLTPFEIDSAINGLQTLTATLELLRQSHFTNFNFFDLQNINTLCEKSYEDIHNYVEFKFSKPFLELMSRIKCDPVMFSRINNDPIMLSRFNNDPIMLSRFNNDPNMLSKGNVDLVALSQMNREAIRLSQMTPRMSKMSLSTMNSGPRTTPEQFLLHDDLIAEQSGSGVLLRLKNNGVPSRIAVYNLPVRECKYRIEIKSIKPSNRWLYFGIATRDQVDTFRDNLISGPVCEECPGYNGVDISYCKMAGQHVGKSDAGGIRVGLVFFLELSVSKRLLKIFTTDKRVDLVTQGIVDTDYFIFHRFHFMETSIHVERIL